MDCEKIIKHAGKLNFTFLCVEETHSTNDLVRRYTQERGGVVVLADRQSEGRGRRGRSFISQQGGVYLSLLWRPERDLNETLHYTALTGLAVCDTVEKLYGVRPALKWPNDVLLKDRKICGILTEAVVDGQRFYLIIGIGLNVENRVAGLVDGADSLFHLTGKGPPRELVAGTLIRQVVDILSRAHKDKEELLSRYRANCATLGRAVQVSRGGETISGRATGIDENAALLLETRNGDILSVRSGEATILKTPLSTWEKGPV